MNSFFASLEAPFTSLFSGIAQSAGNQAAQAAAKNPAVQSALADLEARVAQAQKVAYIAAGVAGVVVLFYYVPRFERPVPRIFRKGGRR